MKKLFILFILLLSVGICNVHAEGTAIHIDDRVIYGNTIVGYFETNEDYDTISFDVTKNNINIKSITVDKDNNYSFEFNSLEYDFGEFFIKNAFGVANDSTVDLNITKKIIVWDGDVTAPILNGINYQLLNYPNSSYDNKVFIGIDSEDDNNISKWTMELLSSSDEVVSFTKYPSGTSAMWNIDYGYWKIKSVTLCDDSYDVNCKKYDVLDKKYEFFVLDSKKKTPKDVNFNFSIDKRFVLKDEIQNISLNIDDDEYKYACVYIYPGFDKHEWYCMDKNESNYSVSYDVIYSAGFAYQYVSKLFVMDQYGRYQIVEYNSNEDTYYRVETDVKNFAPVILDAHFENNNIYVNETVKLILNAIPYNNDYSSLSTKIRFYNDNNSYYDYCDFEYENNNTYSCNLSLYNVGQWSIDYMEIYNNTTIYEYSNFHPNFRNIITVNERPLYNITFKDEDGTVLHTEQFELDSFPNYNYQVPSKPSTVEYSYVFNGWTPLLENVTKDATYTATYNSVKNKYTVIWKNYDGEILETDKVEYGLLPTYDGETPVKERTQQYTFTFAGWDKEVTSVVKDVTYTAMYNETINKYTVTFKDDNNEVISSNQYDYDTLSNEIEIPNDLTDIITSKYTYKFIGWQPEITNVTSDITYYPIYDSIINKYTVTWKDYDGTILEIDENVEYGTIPTYDGDIPFRQGDAQYSYSFVGWGMPGLLSNGIPIQPVTDNTIYVATYSQFINQYLVTFKDDNNEVISNIKYDYGTLASEIEIPNLTDIFTPKYTYKFIGWQPEITNVTSNITYYPLYNQITNKYTVTWKNYNGTILEIDENVEYGTMPTYDGLTPTREKTQEYTYDFIGWDKQITNVSSNTTYTAIYNNNPRIYVDSISINKNNLTLNKNEEFLLIATINPSNVNEDKTLTWTSSNENVATVDSNGKINALGRGNATITVKSKNNKSTVCNLTVIDPKVLSLNVNKDVYNIYSNKKYITINYEIEEQDNPQYEITFTSDNPSVADVNNNVNIQNEKQININGVGTAHITIKAENIEKVVTINVTYIPKIYVNSRNTNVNFSASDGEKTIYNNIMEDANYNDYEEFASNSNITINANTHDDRFIPLIKIYKKENMLDVTDELLSENQFTMPNYDIQIEGVKKQVLFNWNTKNIDFENNYIYTSYSIISDNNSNTMIPFGEKIELIMDIQSHPSYDIFEYEIVGIKIYRNDNNIEVTNSVNHSFEKRFEGISKKWYVSFDMPEYDIYIEPVYENVSYKINIEESDSYTFIPSSSYGRINNKTIGSFEFMFVIKPKNGFDYENVTIKDSEGKEIEYNVLSHDVVSTQISFMAPYSEVTIEPIMSRRNYNIEFTNTNTSQYMSSSLENFNIILSYIGPQRTNAPTFDIYRYSDNKLINDEINFDGKSFIMPNYDVLITLTAGPLVLNKPNVIIKRNENMVELEIDKQLDATRYEVYRSTDKKKWSKIYLQTNSYVNNGLAYGKTYYYKVKACDNYSNCSPYSNIVSSNITPNKVENAKISSAGSNNVKISYDKVNVSGYEVYYGTSTKKMKKATTISKSSTLTYNKTKLKANTTYYFKVRAYKKVGSKKVYGSFSAIVSTKTAPTKPTLSVSVKDYKSLSIKLNSSKGASLYTLEVSEDKKNYSLVEELPTNGLYVHSDLEVGKTYYYRVKVCNTLGNCSSYSNVVSKKVVPTTPSISVSSPLTKQVLVKLTKQEGTVGYEIYRSNKKNKGYKKIVTLLDADEIYEYLDTTNKGKTYYYKVRTYTLSGDNKVYSSYSSVKKIKSK